MVAPNCSFTKMTESGKISFIVKVVAANFNATIMVNNICRTQVAVSALHYFISV
uniref:Uncharacterized protein n=1 Tax=Arion vulgaris TaxID=1028688 RepID=A0A0B7AGM1_9EUPU